MDHDSFFPRWQCSAVTLLACLLLPGSLPAQSGQPDFEQYWERVFRGNHVLQIEFTVSRENWDSLTASSRSRRGDQQVEYVRATMVIDGERLEDVGFRFKGNSSLRFAGNSPRKPLKVDTNRFVEGQKIGGSSKLNLSNVFKDPTYLREKLGYEAFRAAGVPTPGVGWARVVLNVEGLYEKESLGLYVLVQQVNDDLLERQLGTDSKDSLLMKPEMFTWQYLGENPEAYEAYEIKEGRAQEELIARFAELLKLMDQADDEQFASRVGELLDLDNFAAYLAANALLVNLDSIVAMPHNYYLLVDEADGRLKILPWDLNECFGVFSIGRTPADLASWDLDRPWVIEHRILLRLFQVESFRQRYNGTVRKLVDTFFSEKELFARIDELGQVVRPELEKLHGEAAAAAQQAGVEGGNRQAFALKPFIRQRIASVRAQLAGEEEGLVLQSFQRRRPQPLEMTPLQKLWADVAAAEQAEEYDRAIEAVQKVIEMTAAGEDGYINLRLGWLNYLKRDYQVAVGYYATAALAMPAALSPRQGLMACYQALGDADRVVEAAEGIVSIHAANYQANKTLGDIYYGKSEYATAALYYRHLATLNPVDLAMLANLGWCYLQLGQLDQAEQLLNNVLTVSPLDNSARQGISRLQVMRRGQAASQAVMKRLMAVLDSDGDGELSEQEMAGAAAMLEKLDLDKDGTITAGELRSPVEEPPEEPSR